MKEEMKIITGEETLILQEPQKTTENEVLFEDTSKRSERVKHFRMKDGSFMAAIYDKPVHYLDEKTGKYSIANPSILTMDYNSSTNNWTSLKGNYYTYGAQETETAWFLNSNATSSGSQLMNSGSPYAYIQVKASTAIKYTSEQIESSADVSTYIAYSSTDPSAYSAEDGFIALGTIKDKVLDLALESEVNSKYDITTALNNSETEIPTSSAVYKAIETQTGMANVFATATIL